ncbi:MAG: PAS domain S-box protein [Bacteroidales bacterium]|nr:PAS domain S-box protein [Bacteroidales bacterium]
MLKILEFSSENDIVIDVKKKILNIYPSLIFLKYSSESIVYDEYDFILLIQDQTAENTFLTFLKTNKRNSCPLLFYKQESYSQLDDLLIKGQDLVLNNATDAFQNELLLEYFLNHIVSNQKKINSGEEYLNSWNLFNLISKGIIITDSEGDILFYNNACDQYLGFADITIFDNKIWCKFSKSKYIESFFYSIVNQTNIIDSFIVDDLNIEGEKVFLNFLYSRSDKFMFGKELFIFMLSDLTKLKKNEDALDFERQLLTQLMDNIPDSIYFKDINKKYIRVNKAHAKLLGLPYTEMAVGKSTDQFLEGDFANKTNLDDDNILQGKLNAYHTEEYLKDANGIEKWLSVIKAAIRDKSGNITGIVGISRDISQRKEAEEHLKSAKHKAEQADELKTAFLANMSHEIRTPMNTIIGFSELLKSQVLTEEERTEYLSYIIDGGNTLLNLIDDILDFAKIESGQISIKKGLCKVNTMLSEVLVAYEREKNRRGKVNVRLLADKSVQDEDFSVLTDRNRLKQVLSNIILNALKFTDNGFIKVGYVIEADFLKFYVKDTGIGIPFDKHDIVFSRFGQADGSVTRNHGGTGLGMAISKSIIELLGGKIWFESAPDVGTTFYFTVPFSENPKTESCICSTIETDKIIPKWNGKIIIIAEDEDNNYKYLEAALKSTNAILIRATNGKELIDFLKTSDFVISAVLCDLKMPEIDGYQAIEIIRNELHLEIPIIAQTGYAMIGEKQKCLKSGFTDYLAKPVKSKNLINTLLKYL